MQNLKATVELAQEAILGEGPVWDEVSGQLYWIDIKRNTVFRYNPSGGAVQSWQLQQMVGCIAIVDEHNIICALQDKLVKLDTQTGEQELVAPIEADLPDNRCNDGKPDVAGRFWVGTLHIPGEKGKASLYRVDNDRSIHKEVTNLGMSNGLAWSPDNTKMYLIDTLEKQLLQFDFNVKDGSVTNKKILLDLSQEEGSPDGMCIDVEGNVWIAFYGGKRVTCYNPSNGEKLREVEVPAVNVTCCTFGGTNLDTLYITTARDGVSEEDLAKYPDTGALFSVIPGVRGPVANKIIMNYEL